MLTRLKDCGAKENKLPKPIHYEMWLLFIGRSHFFVLKVLIHLDISLKGGIFEVGTPGMKLDEQFDETSKLFLKKS